MTQATLGDVVQAPFNEFIYKLGYKDLVQVRLCVLSGCGLVG